MRDLHSPSALRENIRNWLELTRALFRLLDLEVARSTHEDEGKALLGELKELPSVAVAIAARPKAHPATVRSVEFLIDRTEFRMFSLIATVGMRMNTTPDDLRIKTLFQADEQTRRLFMSLER